MYEVQHQNSNTNWRNICYIAVYYFKDKTQLEDSVLDIGKAMLIIPENRITPLAFQSLYYCCWEWGSKSKIYALQLETKVALKGAH